MKFIKLEILNLASLDRQEGEVIDFEKGALAGSTIFSIVGPTGSGKSTLLDAICLALYNRAPRYPRKKNSRDKIEIYGEADANEKNRLAPTDSRNILTQGKKNGYSKLTFLDNNGIIYRAEWHVRFNIKNYDEARTILYKLTDNDGSMSEEEARWEDIPTIVGLDYEQFLRTVLIAQGTFANFLTSSENERYELLEKLIGCGELYSDIATKIKQEKENAEKLFTEISSSYSTYENHVIEEEPLKELLLKIASLEEEESKAKIELGKVVEELGWYAKEEEYLKNIADFGNAFNIAIQNVNAAADDAERLKKHDITIDAVKLYRDLLTNRQNFKNCEKTLDELNGKNKTKSDEIAKNEKELIDLKASAEKANNAIETQKPHINKARVLRGELTVAQNILLEKIKNSDAASRSYDIATKAVNDNSTAIYNSKKLLEEAQTELSELLSSIEKEREKLNKEVDIATTQFDGKANEIKDLDASALQEAVNTATKNKNDAAEAKRIRLDIDEKNRQISNFNNLANTLNARNSEIATQLSAIDTDSLTSELETLQKSHTLMTSQDWQLHRRGLSEGTPCPLCGATHHPYKDDNTFAPLVNDLEKIILQKKQDLEKLTAQKDELNKELNTNSGTISTLNSNAGNANHELQLSLKQWSDIHGKHPDWPEETTLLKDIVAQTIQEAQKAENELKEFNNKSKDLENLRKNKENAEKALRDFNDTVDLKIKKAERKVSDADTTLKTETGKRDNLIQQQQEKEGAKTDANNQLDIAKNEVANKQEAFKHELGGEDPDTIEKKLEKERNDATDAIEKKNDIINNLRNELNELKGKIDATEKIRNEELSKGKDNRDSLDKWIEEYNATVGMQEKMTIDTIKEISNYTDNWDSLRTLITKLNNELTAASTTLTNEKNNHTTHQGTKPQSDKDTLLARKKELENHSNSELIEAKARHERHEDALKQMGSLVEQKQEAEIRKKEWKEVFDAIGADGKTLRKIAQCYTLRFLVEHANAEIRKFNNRYELQQVKNSLGIRVIDHDRADDVRDTTSLSGGETFIVSLGLALGLSSLSSRNISFENLFIDEGFGTLDPDTLATVIDSLAMLQSSQGKKVGVISHTDTMSERITTQIRVIKNGNTGSSHIEIYP